MDIKLGLASTASVMALLAGLSTAAKATPYAYASNVISGLSITYSDRSPIAASTATTSISDTAQFDGFPVSGFQVGGTVGTSSTINQAYSGSGSAPAAIYTPLPVGSFTGTRSDAAIIGGTASSGGVGVQNVAEGYGRALGNSGATNNAAITFSVVGTGRQLLANFSDLVQLIASTASVPGETASASLQNNLSITASGATTPLASFSPSDINRQISSSAGVPSSNTVGPVSYLESFLTPVLTTGVLYNIALTSTASETIQPGTPVSTPEPASLGMLGAGLVGLGLLRRRPRAK